MADVVDLVRETRIAATFVDLADTLVDDFDVIEFLQSVATHCVEVLNVDAAGLVLADWRGGLRTVAASDEQTRLLGLLEQQRDEGPCQECIRTGTVVPGLDLNQARDRWPHFAPAALEAGFATAYAVPMRLRQDVIGALGLFHRTSGDPHDTWLAQAMADAATIGILQHRSIRRGEDLAAQLQTALTSRIAIEQAKGMLAERQRIDVDEAFTLLRADARRLQRPLPAHAADLLAGRVTISPDGEVDG